MPVPLAPCLRRGRKLLWHACKQKEQLPWAPARSAGAWSASRQKALAAVQAASPRASLSWATSILDTAQHIRRYGYIDLLRVGQAELRHQLHELLPAFREARVEAPFLFHSRDIAALVVVARVNQGVPRQREDLGVHAIMQQTGVALLEVCTPTTTDQQRVTGEGHVGCAPEEPCGAAAGVPGGGDRLECELTEAYLVAWLGVHVRPRARGLGDHGLDL
mmetsp:Transcript_41695/g.104755  ORF Transcript_41695/g.104755 Transcript_41695/m.104755 type:complete len:219 (-) Transcript_41695:53-709(-)